MDKERLQQITAPLLTWFAEHARDLPWRIRPTAYRVWVSEIMLQQTRVEAVKPFYARFMEALPDVTDLAACPEDRLLKLWEGLGYYSRVRNMQKAARMICEQYDGVMPVDYETLLTLPGIGSYTAGAIASIAGGEAAPAVDGNVLRVVTRICESRAEYHEAVRQKGSRGRSAAGDTKGAPGGIQSGDDGAWSDGLRTKWCAGLCCLSGTAALPVRCGWKLDRDSGEGTEEAAPHRGAHGTCDSGYGAGGHSETTEEGIAGRIV